MEILVDECDCGRVTEEKIPKCEDCDDQAEYTTDYKSFCYDHLCEYLMEQYAEMSVEETEVCTGCGRDANNCDCKDLCYHCGQDQDDCTEDCDCDECKPECDSCGCTGCYDDEDCCLSGFECECGCNDE